MSEIIKNMIATFDAECAASGHGWAASPLGGEYCQSCGVTRSSAAPEGVPDPELLRTLLKGEFTSFTVGFNEEHACNHTTAQSWCDEWGHYGEDGNIDWASDEERIKAIAENSVWTIQWYPETPCGFCRVGASTFEAAATYALTE